jgi:hypothetical protein
VWIGIPRMNRLPTNLKNKKQLNLPKKCKIESAASKDKTRHSIIEPYLEIRESGSRMIATDGRILVVVPVETTPDDVSGYVSADALKASRKGKQVESVIRCNGALETWDGASYPRPDLGTYPNVDQVMPKNEATHGKRKIRFSVDAALLSRLADAMGTDGVTLEFLADESDGSVSDPLMVTPRSTSDRKCATIDALGVLMPMR